MIRSRRILVCLLFTAVAAFGVALGSFASAQQLGEGMDRSGSVGIQNETERALFSSLICTCGCPREDLSSCTCGFAHARRAELRAELGKGKSFETIQAEYAKRYGSQALAVPPNRGSLRLVWLVPLGAIAFGGIFATMVLRRWRTTNMNAASAELNGAPQASEAARDGYDDRLDDQLKDMD